MDPNSAPEVVPYSNLEHYNQNNSAYNDQHDKNSPLTGSSQQPRKRKIAGLAPTTFWLLVILAIVIIVAAVGGGVGGSMAVAKAKKRYALIHDGIFHGIVVWKLKGMIVFLIATTMINLRL